MVKSPTGTDIDPSQPLASHLLTETEAFSDLSEDNETKPSSSVNLTCLLKFTRIAADYIEAGIEALFWQITADAIDNYANVHPDDSYWNHYSVLGYFARCLGVGAAQGITKGAYTFILKSDLIKAFQDLNFSKAFNGTVCSDTFKIGLCSMLSGIIWQPSADIFPLNKADTSYQQICFNTTLVGFITGGMVYSVNKLLSIKHEDMPAFICAMAAIGFSLAYPMPAPEPPGERQGLGAFSLTIAGTVVGDLLSRFGMFCYKKICVKQPEQKSEHTSFVSPKNP